MTTSTVDRLVADYLTRLEAASTALPPDRRDELLDEIGDHIATARAAGAAADEAAVRTLLDRLGPPEVIVAAALDDGPPTDARPGWVSAPPSTGLELAAVLMLTVGSFLPVVGWLVGVVLLWVSSRWTTAEKLLGTLVVPLGPGGVLIAATGFVGQTCLSSVETSFEDGRFVDEVVSDEVCTGAALPQWLGIPLFVLALVAPIVVAVVLYRRARARADLAPPREVRRTAWGGLEIAAVLVMGLAGGAVPVVGAVVALVLVWSSPAWRTLEKSVATILCAVSVASLASFYLLLLQGLAPVLLSGLGPLIAAVYLAVVLNRRR